jgi:cyclic beta-1,2-glucan synthetase
MYRAGLESILGFQLAGASLRIDPCIPRGWREFEITYKHGRRGATRYHIKVENPHGVCRGIAKLEIDGKVQQSSEIVLADDAQSHEVRVILGERDAA